MHWLSRKRYKVAFLIPSLLVYTLFIVVPIFVGIGYSFTKYTGIGKAKFNGLSNYQRLVHDKLFWSSLTNSLVIFVVASVMLLVLSFALALLLNSKLKFSDTSKALIFSPAIIAPIIVGIIWVYILDPKIGLINSLLHAAGLDSFRHQWIGGTVLTPYSTAIIFFWQQLGYLTTIFIAGLKMIPEEIIEAARVDGASAWKRTICITIPMMRSTISTVVVLIITGIFKIFEIVQQTTGGGPNHLSETLVTYAYSVTFQNGQYGYGMSIATVTFVISLGITGIYMLLSRDGGEN